MLSVLNELFHQEFISINVTSSLLWGRLIVTNDGRGTDLQVWDLGGEDSGEI